MATTRGPSTSNNEPSIRIVNDDTPAVPADENKDEWVTNKLEQYDDNGLMDEELVDEFRLDFALWSKEDFDKLKGDTRRDMRKHFESYGVYVGKAGSPITPRLIDTLDTTFMPEWPEKELQLKIKGCIGKYGKNKFFSRHNYNMEGTDAWRRRQEEREDAISREVNIPSRSRSRTRSQQPTPGPTPGNQRQNLPQDDQQQQVQPTQTQFQGARQVEQQQGQVSTAGSPRTDVVGQSAASPAPPFGRVIGTPQTPQQDNKLHPSETYNYAQRANQNTGTAETVGPDESHDAALQQQFEQHNYYPRQQSSFSSNPSSNVALLEKNYKTVDKFSGANDVLDDCLRIFDFRCLSNNIPESDKWRAVHVMLDGDARLYYFRVVAKMNWSYDTQIAAIRTEFETEHRRNRKTNEWETADLKEFYEKNSKTMTLLECYEQLRSKLIKEQGMLRPELQTDSIIRDKLYSMCSGIRACDLALFNRKLTFSAASEDLRNSIGLRSATSKTQTFNTRLKRRDSDSSDETERKDHLMTERKYRPQQSRYQQSKGGRNVRFSRSSPPRQQFRSYPKSPHNHRSEGFKGTCWICHKYGCKSTNHSQEEQDREKEQFKKRTGWNDRQVQQFVNETENLTPDASDVFDELIDSMPLEESDDDYQQNVTNFSTVYTTSQFGNFKGQELLDELEKQSVFHVFMARYNLNSCDATPSTSVEAFLGTRYSTGVFMGILIDSGAAHSSTAGYNQFIALQKHQEVKLDETRAGEVRITFGIGEAVSLGTAKVNTPIGQITFHVVPSDTPFLLCLADLDRLKVYYNNLENALVSIDGKTKVPVARAYGHPWMLLDPSKALVFVCQGPWNNDLSTAQCHLTYTQFEQLHQQWGHVSPERMAKILGRAGFQSNIKELKRIVKHCIDCQKHGRKPARFKFTIRKDREFNHTVYIDIFWLSDGPVLHVVDAATAYQAAEFVSNKGDMTAEKCWEAFEYIWIHRLLGAPEYVVTDPGTNFASKTWKNLAQNSNVKAIVEPVEAHWSIGKVERYHAILRRIYNIFRDAFPDSAKENVLQMALKAINDSVGPDGLVPTLLVFGAFPRMVDDDIPHALIAKRGETYRKAMAEARRCHAARWVADGLSSKRRPMTSHLKDLPLNSEVWAWREKKGWTKGVLVAMEGETCQVRKQNGKITTLRSTVVKPLHEPPSRETHNQPEHTAAGAQPGSDDRSDDIPTDTASLRPSQANDFIEGDTIIHEEPLKAAETRRSPRNQPQLATPAETGQEDDSPESSEPEGDTIVVEVPGNIRRNYNTAPTTKKLLAKVQIPDGMEGSKQALEALFTQSFPSATHVEVYLTEKETQAKELSIELRAKGIITTPGGPFVFSRRKEMDGLQAQGVFEVICKWDSEIGDNRIFGSRLVDEVKGKETATPYEKSRLVIQAWNDLGKKEILTQSPTIQRAAQRLICAVAPSLIELGILLFLRDITQAYTQSKSRLNRDFYAYPPREMAHEFPDDAILKIILPLYGIPESGNHWFKTYHEHHKEKLNMETSTFDPCLLVSKDNTNFGLVGMQTDDTLILGTAEFIQKEENELNKAQLKAKPIEALTTQTPLQFNGCKLALSENGDALNLTQNGQARRLELVNPKDPDRAEKFKKQRARAAYIASICQPEASFDCAVAAQHQDPSEGQIDALNKRIAWQMANIDRGLHLVPLDLKAAKIFVFVDGSLANNTDYTSQIGYVIALGNEEQGPGFFTLTGNLIHWTSTKCKRVTRAILASELYGMVAGMDMAICLSTTVAMICRQLKINPLPTVICTDSFSLYECMVKLGTTKEKRLMIDIMAIRQSYERREISEIRWIAGDCNPADAMTKAKANNCLTTLVSTNQLKVKVEGWVQRDVKVEG